ncbi:indolepyruvate oxidoreductase subunit beta family protein [Ovoidimarina sediminis]|uniref:indolepyruvate oxidoreductase subunit beta family protein n=1 Tax=Ovoidimarina sediminis TaxID=3079856 RepID=UPI00290EA299|nr:indolepyruvate oxidoreductase subunit beta family protein [Rhodophyticola sp. MJ-SS7]MDU8944684.1 indolepyruvate oxidoreductase subunit beta family protein [Rhodophyticola sp. MJ-SS7]
MTAATDTLPTRLLIAAMGGEGGGVLAGWLTEAALMSGLWVQRTSVPGVAQRTGATTYYLEFLPRTGDRRPVMGLHPTPGQVDVLVATELLEAMRMVQAGHVTPDRTRLFASTHRAFTVDEKSAMADGRLDPTPMIATCRAFAREATIRDLSEVARAAECHLNSVILGLLAGSGALPIPKDACRKAIEAGKRASEANRRGFEAGLALAAQEADVPDLRGRSNAPTALISAEARPEPILPASPETEFLPDEAAGLAAEALRRLTDYQDGDYAALYLSHLRRLAGHPAANPAFLAALARHMAVRMSYEDTHRVAELKLRQTRLSRVKAEAKARDGDIVDVAEYMKPGPEEIFGMLPEALGRKLIAISDRRGWGNKSFPMKVRTTRFSGFIRLKLLAAAKRWRLKSLRHSEEIDWLNRWLGHIGAALDTAPAAALEITETARLVRGYGSTYKRGLRNWRLIEAEVITPCLDGSFPADMLADAVLQARLAAVKDPDGDALDKVVAAFRKVAADKAA